MRLDSALGRNRIAAALYAGRSSSSLPTLELAAYASAVSGWISPPRQIRGHRDVVLEISAQGGADVARVSERRVRNATAVCAVPGRRYPTPALRTTEPLKASYSTATTTTDFGGSSTRSSFPFFEALNGAGFTASGLSNVFRASSADAVRNATRRRLYIHPVIFVDTEALLFGSTFVNAICNLPFASRAADTDTCGSDHSPREYVGDCHLQQIAARPGTGCTSRTRDTSASASSFPCP